MKIILASPRGFCAGVDRAIQIVEKALTKYGSPVYVRHEIVHNKSVVQRLRDQGAVFVEELYEVPEGAPVIFSAHGVAESVYEAASKKDLKIIDAACPLVKKVHSSAKRHDKNGAKVILIGHAGHPEVEGTMGQLDAPMYLVGTAEDVDLLPLEDAEDLAYITQTTLSIDETKDVIDALRRKFPNIRGPESGDLCYATTNRQSAVKILAEKVDLLLVVGSSNSSNSNRLKELGTSMGVRSYLIDRPEMIEKSWFDGVQTVGISSGASAPEDIVQAVVAWIQKEFEVGEVSEDIVLKENVKFSLPKELEGL